MTDRPSRSSVGSVPAPVVLVVWLLLGLSGLGVAQLVGAAAMRADIVKQIRLELTSAGRLRERIVELLSQPPFTTSTRDPDLDPHLIGLDAFIDRQAELSAAVRKQRWTGGAALGAGFVWLVACGVATIGTGRWVTARRGWYRVQSWHGGKLLILYALFLTAAFSFAGAFASLDTSQENVTWLTASSVLLLAPAGLLVRATWNWLTGRERGWNVSPRTWDVTLTQRERDQQATSPAADKKRGLASILRSRKSAMALVLAFALLAAGAVGFVIARRPKTYADCVLCPQGIEARADRDGNQCVARSLLPEVWAT